MINSGQRHRTNLSANKQGDHFFAYSAMTSAITSCFHGRSLGSNTGKLFDEFAARTMSEEEFDKYEPIGTQEHLTDRRFNEAIKEVTAGREAIQIFSEKTHQSVKSEKLDQLYKQAKDGRVNIRARNLSDGINRYLEIKQTSRNTSYSKGRVNKKDKEDSLVSNALDALAALDKIAQILNADDVAKTELINEIENNEQLLSGINTLCKEILHPLDWNKSANALLDRLRTRGLNIEKCLKKFQNCIASKYLGKINNLAAKYVNDLFDYPQKIIFNVDPFGNKECAINLTDNEKSDWATKTKKEELIIEKIKPNLEKELLYEDDSSEQKRKAKFNKSFTLRYDDDLKKLTVERKDKETYYKQLKNAYCLAIECYQNLLLEDAARQELLKAFVRLTLIKQDWKNVFTQNLKDRSEQKEQINSACSEISVAVEEISNTDQEKNLAKNRSHRVTNQLFN